MGYTIWDRVSGGPANKTRYATKHRADSQCMRLNFKPGNTDRTRYYVKAL